MKNSRHQKILELIEKNTVTTQEKLQQLLDDAGYSATQATISRDIKELRLVKTLSPSGVYYYSRPASPAPGEEMQFNINSVFLEAISSVERVNNFVVVHTFPGMASALCEVLDKGNWLGLAGTVAGDNTIFVMLRSDHQAEEFLDFLQDAAKKVGK